MGDFVLTLPLIRALRLPFEKVDVLANRAFADLSGKSAFALDDLDLAPFFVPQTEFPQKWRDYFSRYQLVISYLHDPDRSFERNVRACGCATFVAGPHRIEDGAHATEQLARPLHQLGIAIADWAPKLEHNQAETAAVCAEFPLPLMALHPGSGSARKNWPINNWIGLTQQLLACGRSVVVIGGEADEGEIAAMRNHLGDRVEYAIKWPLRKLSALLSGARFIGHDSGVSHLAAAAGASCTVLFGPTDPKTWAPRGNNVRVHLAPGGNLIELKLELVVKLLLTRGLLQG